MCGRAYELRPDLRGPRQRSASWAGGGRNIVFRKEIAASTSPEEERARRVGEFRALIDRCAAGAALVDDVIDPARDAAHADPGLEMAVTKKVDRPWKKHGVDAGLSKEAARRRVAGRLWAPGSAPVSFRRRP